PQSAAAFRQYPTRLLRSCYLKTDVRAEPASAPRKVPPRPTRGFGSRWSVARLATRFFLRQQRTRRGQAPETRSEPAGRWEDQIRHPMRCYPRPPAPIHLAGCETLQPQRGTATTILGPLPKATAACGRSSLAPPPQASGQSLVAKPEVRSGRR